MRNVRSIIFAGLCMLFCAAAYTQSVEDVTVTMIYPVAGQELTAGQTVEILWNTVVPKGLDCAWCEQEIFLSLDGGQTLSRRLTRQLGPEIGRYTWVVPDTPSDNAVLLMQFGIEDAMSVEIRPSQNSMPFRILPSPVQLETVRLLSYEGPTPTAGDRIKVRWESTVKSVHHYEVYVSFDLGAHFTKLGDATRKRITWKVPRHFHGSVNFRVDAVRNDGSIVESGVNAQRDLFVP